MCRVVLRSLVLSSALLAAMPAAVPAVSPGLTGVPWHEDGESRPLAPYIPPEGPTGRSPSRLGDDDVVRGMDPELVSRAQRGDQQAFHAVAEAAQPRLYRLAFGVLRDPTAASEATQQALIAVWRYLPRLRDPARFDAWSYRLLVRACSTQYGQGPRWLPDGEVSAGREPLAADESLAVLHRDQLERGFERLSVDHRAVIALRYLVTCRSRTWPRRSTSAWAPCRAGSPAPCPPCARRSRPMRA